VYGLRLPFGIFCAMLSTNNCAQRALFSKGNPKSTAFLFVKGKSLDLRIWHKRHKSLPAGNIILIQGIYALGFGQVEDKLNVIIVKYLAQLSLILLREQNLLASNVRIPIQEILNLLARAE